MNKQDAVQFRERWRIANRVISEEIRNTPLAVKAKQIAASFQAARAMRLVSNHEPFERWRQLREKHNG